MLTEKYEFDTAAIGTIFREFVKRKFNLPAGSNVRITHRVTNDPVAGYTLRDITVEVKRNQDAESADNTEVLRSMAEGNRKIDVGQL